MADLPPNPSTEPSPHSMADRYGTRRPRARVVGIVALGLLGGAALGWLAWAAWFNAHPAVSVGVVGYRVEGTHSMAVEVQARQNDLSEPGVCTLRVSAEDHSVVGERRITVDVTEPQWSGSGKTRQRSYDVRTERRATSVDVVGCRPLHR